MSILFRCPCGRSMVVESDRAGAVVTCPNCRRSLKVPSGKGRGVEIPAAPTAATTRTSRRCKRCNKDVPVDSQICPHCNAILLDEAPTAAPVKTVSARPSPAGRPSPGIMYGGARGSWFTRLTPGGKAGVLIGAFVFVALAGLIAYFIASAWHAGQVTASRERCRKALEDGRKLENRGQFQEAYNMYSVPTEVVAYLTGTTLQKDTELADALHARAIALQYLIPQPKTREAVQWKPQSQAEFDQALAHLKATYPAYRQLCLALGDAGLAAAAAGKANPPQAEFEAKVTLAVEAYMRLIEQTTVQQRAQFTFQTLTQGLRELASANRHWDDNERNIHLGNAEGYFSALKERVSKPGYPDNIW